MELRAHLRSKKHPSTMGCQVSDEVEQVEIRVMLCSVLFSFRDSLFVSLPLSVPQLLPKDKKKQLIIHYTSLK